MKYIALFLALSLSACQKDETISGQTDPTDIWHLSQMNASTVSEEITLTFPEKGKVAGKAPCNQYFAAQTAVLPWFEIGAIGATKRACPQLDLENEYFQMLAEMTQAERVGDALVLSNDAGAPMEFRLK